ncbi:DUF1684 domain-containing protein [Halomarina ordinaria]|uniref:DUF1684 domain-containing protein n=1 Tax=Halomarina ordinaria TaxID=3033939 RepID=A0ABD5U916_9EURY|nr:DUF1684 domain-containing protein [Halomarina sp. PSRA2]
MTDDFDEDDWREQLDALREEKDAFFADHPQSPVPPEHREGFEGLAYFDPDPSYRVDARVERHDDPEPVTMETTNGPEVRYERVATLHFDLGGEERTLGAYRQDPDDQLFVPFRDKTTGQESYHRGRYMELDVEGELPERVPLDFNLAYNPFCAYSETFACPLPPEGNWLGTVVEAGERDVKF